MLVFTGMLRESRFPFFESMKTLQMDTTKGIRALVLQYCLTETVFPLYMYISAISIDLVLITNEWSKNQNKKVNLLNVLVGFFSAYLPFITIVGSNPDF